MHHLILTITQVLILTLVDAIGAVIRALIQMGTAIQIVDTQLTRTLLNVVLSFLIQIRSSFIAELLHLDGTVKQTGCRLLQLLFGLFLIIVVHLICKNGVCWKFL